MFVLAGVVGVGVGLVFALEIIYGIVRTCTGTGTDTDTGTGA